MESLGDETLGRDGDQHPSLLLKYVREVFRQRLVGHAVEDLRRSVCNNLLFDLGPAGDGDVRPAAHLDDAERDAGVATDIMVTGAVFRRRDEEAAILIGMLILVLTSWWSLITQGLFPELYALSQTKPQAMEYGDFAGNQVDQSSEVPCDSAGQGDWDFLELLGCVAEG